MAAIVGKSFDSDVFNRPVYGAGWTHEKVADFVESRKSAQVVVNGHTCPTFSFLAWYFATHIVLSYRQGEHWRLYLIDEMGLVTDARYTGDRQGLEDFRHAYLWGRPEDALKRPELQILAGPASTPADSWELRAKTCLEQLQNWKQQHTHTSLPVPAPQGPALSAADLDLAVPSKPAEIVLARATSRKHRYEIRYPLDSDPTTLEATCTVDGTPQRFTNPITGLEEGMHAPAADWAQWILTDSAETAGATVPKLWEVDEPEAELYRISNNIVRYEEHEVATSHFRTSTELQAWLRASLGNHNVPLLVRTLDDIHLVLDLDRMPMYQKNVFNRSEGKDPRVSYAPRIFHPWKGLENWREPTTGQCPHYPRLQTVMDGRELQAYTATNCLNFESLQNDLLPDDAPSGPNSWFIIGVEQGLHSPTCIVFPAADSILSVTTDNDGATALITARDYPTRNDELHREAAFRNRWSQWLDEDHPLTPEEIQAGLESLKRLIEEQRP
ncbi:hypothetical protein BN1051_03056 [Arthrobacter saudimassiliensis]|uniref:Uncharacterized protein n=1 Tax=Arthrobacter saudimassiliensis TaxID=1461584 RepID=A0A078MTZ3_9MICC|nr:hypothetical protein BN1051_03056 [Arthrobacter saudimassiliensis]